MGQLIVYSCVSFVLAGSSCLAFDTKSARIDDERNCGQLACVITSEYLWKPVILEDVISRLGTNALSVAEIEDYFKSSGFEVIESKPESVASGDKYVVRGTMRIGSIGIFEQSVYISMHSQADSSETVVALKLLATALSGPKLVESSKTISISSFGEAGLYSAPWCPALFCTLVPGTFCTTWPTAFLNIARGNAPGTRATRRTVWPTAIFKEQCVDGTMPT